MSQWIPTPASSVLNVIVIVGLMLFTLYYLFTQGGGISGRDAPLPALPREDDDRAKRFATQ
ncbi:MAG: hypothetical protein WKG07_07540 [Hymenobacter sp.]